jgi:hypothetical protein
VNRFFNRHPDRSFFPYHAGKGWVLFSIGGKLSYATARPQGVPKNGDQPAWSAWGPKQPFARRSQMAPHRFHRSIAIAGFNRTDDRVVLLK